MPTLADCLGCLSSQLLWSAAADTLHHLLQHGLPNALLLHHMREAMLLLLCGPAAATLPYLLEHQVHCCSKQCKGLASTLPAVVWQGQLPCWLAAWASCLTAAVQPAPATHSQRLSDAKCLIASTRVLHHKLGVRPHLHHCHLVLPRGPVKAAIGCLCDERPQPDILQGAHQQLRPLALQPVDMHLVSSFKPIGLMSTDMHGNV